MEQPTVVHSIDLIVSSPNVRSGRPVVRETPTPVADIAIVKTYHPQDADGLAEKLTEQRVGSRHPPLFG